MLRNNGRVVHFLRTQSVDSQLHEAHFDNHAMSVFSAKKKSRKIGGSFEKVLNLLTPRKSKGSKEEPKKTKVYMGPTYIISVWAVLRS